MKLVAILYTRDNNLKLEVYTEDNQEYVKIKREFIPARYINMREFERFEIIEKK